MHHLLSKLLVATATLSLLLFCNRPALAEDAPNPPTVRVTYPSGETESEILEQGVKFRTNRDYLLRQIPDEILGMTFTRRSAGDKADVVIDVPANATVYVIVDSDNDPRWKDTQRAKINETLRTTGWTLVTDSMYIASASHPFLAVYRQTFPQAGKVNLTGGVSDGIVVAAKDLTLGTNNLAAENKPETVPSTTPAPNATTKTAATSPPVHVKFAAGDTELDTVSEGIKLFTTRNYGLINIPPDLLGLTFTRRQGGRPTDVEINASAGATVFLLVDSEKGPNGGVELNKRLALSGWTRLADAEYLASNAKKCAMAVYTRDFSSSEQIALDGAGWSGFIVAADNLILDLNDRSVITEAKASPKPAPKRADQKNDAASVDPATTHISIPQASIKSLEIQNTESGLMLGQTSEMVLTITRGKSPKPTSVDFVPPVGNDTNLARDEALRFIRLDYPTWYADRAEITFEDKYDAHDGGSFGAAIGTMILSVIQGFQIDPDIAITGDISANGKIRAIGAVSAKIHGAIADKCSLVALPNDNYDQLVDAVIYNGPAIVTDIQVIGISNLTGATATMRIDRDPNLANAIEMFASLQKAAKDKPDYWISKDAQDALSKVFALAPEHLSSQILLASASGNLPKTLSATASNYYTFLALNPMLAILTERAESTRTQKVPSAVIRAGLVDLRKLRPIADPNVRPLVDACARFIEAWNYLQQGSGSLDDLETQRESVLDAMAKEQSDPKLMQKMLKEGI